MKIVNLCTKNKPPVVRVHEYIPRKICYELNETGCDITDAKPRNMYPENMLLNQLGVLDEHPFNIGYMPESELYVNYKLYNDKYSLQNLVRVTNNKFSITLPELPKGYYYLDVTYNDASNMVMVNVI